MKTIGLKHGNIYQMYIGVLNQLTGRLTVPNNISTKQSKRRINFGVYYSYYYLTKEKKKTTKKHVILLTGLQ